MAQYFKEREVVVNILDDITHKFIFSTGGISAQSRLEGSVKGNGQAFIKAHVSADRESEFVFLNAWHIRAVENKAVDVPTRIKSFISELNNDSTSDARKEELEEILNDYFSN